MAAAESMLPPCGSQGLSGNQATQSQVLSTSAQLSEHMMFIFGGFRKERRFPVGAYIPDPELLDDQHDAVITQLMMPIGRVRPWIQRAAGGVPQPALLRIGRAKLWIFCSHETLAASAGDWAAPVAALQTVSWALKALLLMLSTPVAND